MEIHKKYSIPFACLIFALVGAPLAIRMQKKCEITPSLLMIIMIWWFINDAIPVLFLKGVESTNVPYIWGARIFMIAMLGLLFWMVHKAWKKVRS